MASIYCTCLAVSPLYWPRPFVPSFSSSSFVPLLFFYFFASSFVLGLFLCPLFLTLVRLLLLFASRRLSILSFFPLSPFYPFVPSCSAPFPSFPRSVPCRLSFLSLLDPHPSSYRCLFSFFFLSSAFLPSPLPFLNCFSLMPRSWPFPRPSIPCSFFCRPSSPLPSFPLS